MLSVDVALPGPDSEGKAEFFELFEPHTPRPPPSVVRAGERGGRRCSRWPFFGRPNTASSALRRKRVDIVRDVEGFFGGDWAEWERDWPAVGGIDHDDDEEDCGCDECRLVAFLQATEPLAVGEKPRVRDVWTPVSADVPEVTSAFPRSLFAVSSFFKSIAEAF